MTACHIHLDPVGGIAGDMFVAAILDAFPDLKEACLAAVAALMGDSAEIQLLDVRSKGFAGAQLRVAPAKDIPQRSWQEIKPLMAGLRPAGAAEHALQIFELLAETEASVHGVPKDTVHFHEVGAIDSIADIAAAGFLIDAIDAVGWSVGPLPLGAGLARTAHGAIPVPAPATVRLLKGFQVVDDGLAGERVTPTGAAILAHLRPSHVRPAGALGETGLGLGTRELPDRVNGLRVLEIRLDEMAAPVDHVAILRFDIDDQPAEDLALGLDRLRALPGVIDITQASAIGKKGRMIAQIRVLATPDQAESVAGQIFRETTTLGLCLQRAERRVLPRDVVEPVPGLHAKRATRPGGMTAKAELDDLAARGGDAAERARLRRKVEQAALSAGESDIPE
ncbi:MAG: LarC family nickel insertion protein [Pseudomonadota bacterium]